MNSLLSGHSASSINILLIEDNIGDVELIIAAFNELKAFYNFHIVHDGEEALDFLHKKGSHAGAIRPNLIFLDLNLPRKNGWEILHNIKQDPALKGIPVIVLTSSQDERDIARCYMLHANSYIIKPLGFNEFVSVIQSTENFWLRIAARLP
jgi:CheY-like chemotaxis protein